MATKFCPVPVYPDDCALSWIERSNPPQCFVEFLDRFDRQQQAIEACQ